MSTQEPKRPARAAASPEEEFKLKGPAADGQARPKRAAHAAEDVEEPAAPEKDAKAAVAVAAVPARAARAAEDPPVAVKSKKELKAEAREAKKQAKEAVKAAERQEKLEKQNAKKSQKDKKAQEEAEKKQEKNAARAAAVVAAATAGKAAGKPEKSQEPQTAAPAGETPGEQGDGEEKEKVDLPTLENLADELKRETYKNNYRRVLRSTVFSLLAVAAVAVLVAMLLLPVLQISGTSMTETLQDGDIVVAVNGSTYDIGDVVAFYYNNDILIKRVIARAGDWVDIDEEGNVMVNGTMLDEPYVHEKALGDCNIELPYQVPDGRCFIMGDHRATSIDSRNTAVGCVSDDMVVGKIIFRIWPLQEISLIK